MHNWDEFKRLASPGEYSREILGLCLGEVAGRVFNRVGSILHYKLSEQEFEFMKYVSKFNKEFNTVEEYKLRFAQYLLRDAFIEEVNSSSDGSPDAYKAGHNQFSTWTTEEYEALLTARAPEIDETTIQEDI